MKTIRRDKLMALVKAGKVVSTGSYHFDDMTGEERRAVEIPCRFSTGYGDFVEGQCNLRDYDFTMKGGSAYLNDDGTIHLRVHSNCSYDLRLINGATISPANKGANKGHRPENVAMQRLLKAHGIDATAKYAWHGSMRGCWRMYNGAIRWTMELAQQLTALGFSGYDNEPLHEFSGNGGTFSVWVRGHADLLEGATAPNS